MTTVPDRRAVPGIRVALGITGAFALVFGALILLWPGRVAIAMTLLIAIWAVAAGMVFVALGSFGRGLTGGARAAHIVLGALSVAAGAAILANAASATTFLTAFIGVAVGIVWIVEGVVALSALGGEAARGWTVMFAIVSILAGVALVFSPIWGAAVLWWLVGVAAVVLGALQLVRAVRWGRG